MKKQFEASDAFKEGRDELNKLLQDFENANDAIINALKILSATYEKTDFELDPKKKEDAKTIKQAHAQFAAFFASETNNLKSTDKAIDELEKHLILMAKYKGPSK